MALLQLGQTFHTPPIPHLAENTRYFDAGPVRIGVEYRHLDAATARAHIAGSRSATGDEDYEAVWGGNASTEEEGVSLHVFDAETGFEHLRFDCFDEDPHYHYVYPDQHHVVVKYDRASNGDMWAWVLGRLRTQLSEMLDFADAPLLAERVRRSADQLVSFLDHDAVAAQDEAVRQRLTPGADTPTTVSGRAL